VSSHRTRLGLEGILARDGGRPTKIALQFPRSRPEAQEAVGDFWPKRPFKAFDAQAFKPYARSARSGGSRLSPRAREGLQPRGKLR
jgi:hypothetical protein